MKPDKQRIAIAEYCGWSGGSIKIYPTNNVWWGRNPNSKDLDFVPDYLNDLNAMNEAEKSLALPYRKEAYWLHLTEVCEPSKEYWRATAAQRAEAFLKTIGKWEE